MSSTGSSQRISFCRVCTNGCGLLVSVEAGRVTHVTGDKDNPLYRGYTCAKGRAQPEMLAHPDRLLRPLMRGRDGELHPAALNDVLDDVARRLAALLDASGPDAVAGYIGTYQIANAAMSPMFTAFLDAVGTSMRFTPNTIDKPGKAIAASLHGRWQAPAQGFDEPDVVLLIGTNPVVTYTGFPAGNPTRWLADRLAAGMQLIVIDPRVTEVARRATIHLRARPGCDALLLAAMAKVIIDEDRYARDFVDAHAAGLGEFRRALEPVAVPVVAEWAGVDPDDLVRAARIYAGAARGYAMAGTGPNMTGRGTLIEYLVLNLQTMCGRWLRAGERVPNPGVLLAARPPRAQASPPRAARRRPMRVRHLAETAAGMPTAALADEILMPGPGQVRGLFSVAGNPVVAWPDTAKTVAALRSLQLLVQIDPWLSATAALATHVIAPRMPLETPGTTQVLDVMSRMGTGYGAGVPFGQWTEAMAEPPPDADLALEWEVFYGLAQRLGWNLDLSAPYSRERVALDMEVTPSAREVLDLLARGSRISLATVREAQHGAIFAEPEVVVGVQEPGWTGRFELADASMMAELREVAERRDDSEDFPFRLLCRRMKHVYNSSVNVPATNRGRPYNPAYLHPRDLAELGLAAGALCEIRSARGSVVAVVEPDEDVLCKTVSMAFGFGSGTEQDDDVREVGTNPSRLIANDGVFDRYSGQPRMTNVPVTISPLPRPAGRAGR